MRRTFGSSFELNRVSPIPYQVTPRPRTFSSAAAVRGTSGASSPSAPAAVLHSGRQPCARRRDSSRASDGRRAGPQAGRRNAAASSGLLNPSVVFLSRRERKSPCSLTSSGQRFSRMTCRARSGVSRATLVSAPAVLKILAQESTTCGSKFWSQIERRRCWGTVSVDIVNGWYLFNEQTVAAAGCSAGTGRNARSAPAMW